MSLRHCDPAAERRCVKAWDASPRVAVQYRDASRGATMGVRAQRRPPSLRDYGQPTNPSPPSLRDGDPREPDMAMSDVAD